MKSMSMIELNVELLSQLTIDGFDNLADSVEGATEGLGQLAVLVAARQGEEFEPIVRQELLSQLSAHVAFVAKDGQIPMLRQQFRADGQVGSTGRSQFKIQNQTTQTNQQMQAE